VKKCFLTLLLALLLVFPYPAQAAVEKNETVYGLLANNGTVKEVQVVNWAHGTPDGEAWTDYGSYNEIKNSVSSIKPKIDGDRLIWPSSAFQRNELFYQGVTDKKLPFNVTIDYTLNGEQIKAEDIAGKDGNLKIHIHLENLTGQEVLLSYQGVRNKQLSAKKNLYTPFLFQISTSLPTEKFKNIKSDGANQVVVGDEIQVAWISFPFPTSDISLEMQGKDIELNPFDISVLPLYGVSISGLDIAGKFGGLNQMLDGLGQLDSSLNMMGTAAQEIQQNQEKIADGCSQVADGLGKLDQGVQKAYEGSELLAGGVNQLRKQLTQQLIEANEQLEQQTQGLIGQLMLLKQDIPTENYVAQMRIDALIDGLSHSSNDIPEEINQLAQLADAANQLNSGLEMIHQGTQELAQQTPQLSEGMKELAKGQGQLADGIKKAADGLSTITEESGGHYNELMQGLAAAEELETLAGNYKSFMDNSNNKSSKVQFLLRTEGIEIPEQAEETIPEKTKTTPWESIKSFFINLFS
jgi:putative membrane protein